MNHKYRGGYRLESDSSWTPLDRLSETDEKTKWANRLMDSSNGPAHMRMLIDRSEFTTDAADDKMV